MNARAEPQALLEQRSPVGTLAGRLQGIYTVLVLLFSLQLLATLSALGLLLDSGSKLESAQYFSRLAVQLESDLNRVYLLATEVLYAGRKGMMSEVLAVNENILLDLEALLNQGEVEQQIQPGHTVLENRAVILSLRSELVHSMVLARAGQITAAQEHFQEGPRYYLTLARNFINDTVLVSNQHIEEQRQRLEELKSLVGICVVALGAIVLALLYLLFRRVAFATRELETNLEQALNLAAQQQRLAALGQIAGSISHELRNPLGTIRTSLFTLGERLEGIAGTEKILARMERNVLRCDRIISGLLDFGRQPQLDMSPTNIKLWLEDLLQQLDLPSGVIVQGPEEDVGLVSIDSEKLRTAVSNVYNNACEAIADSAREGSLHVSLHTDGERVSIVFKDNGSGISSGDLGQIFEPLFSTKTFGVGLGMSIVKQALESQGGGVDIDSQQDVGSTVTLWLPALDQEEAN